LTAARAVIIDARGNPAPNHLRITIMNASLDVAFRNTYNVLNGDALTLEEVRQRAPAVFAAAAHENLSAKYTFVPSGRVLSGLMNAGFAPVDARQARTYRAIPVHAQHVVRLRRRYETIALRDCVPEILFLNSHDGTSAYIMLISMCHH
jgi:hypothetical protein